VGVVMRVVGGVTGRLARTHLVIVFKEGLVEGLQSAVLEPLRHRGHVRVRVDRARVQLRDVLHRLDVLGTPTPTHRDTERERE
jgi:hypothetical protein